MLLRESNSLVQIAKISIPLAALGWQTFLPQENMFREQFESGIGSGICSVLPCQIIEQTSNRSLELDMV